MSKETEVVVTKAKKSNNLTLKLDSQGNPLIEETVALSTEDVFFQNLVKSSKEIFLIEWKGDRAMPQTKVAGRTVTKLASGHLAKDKDDDSVATYIRLTNAFGEGADDTQRVLLFLPKTRYNFPVPSGTYFFDNLEKEGWKQVGILSDGYYVLTKNGTIAFVTECARDFIDGPWKLGSAGALIKIDRGPSAGSDLVNYG